MNVNFVFLETIFTNKNKFEMLMKTNELQLFRPLKKCYDFIVMLSFFVKTVSLGCISEEIVL